MCYSHAGGGFGLQPSRLVSLSELSWEQLAGARQQLSTASGCAEGCPAAAACTTPPASCGSCSCPCPYLALCILRLCTQFSKFSLGESFPYEKSQADPYKALSLSFGSPAPPAALPLSHCSCRGQLECHELLAVPVCSKCLCLLL